VGASNSWPMEEASSSSSPKVPAGSPGYRSRVRRATAPEDSSTLPKPRSRQPSLSISPSLRAAAASTANGAGHAAVGVLKGGSTQEIVPSWGSYHTEKACASGDGVEVVDMGAPKAFETKDIVAPAFPQGGSELPSRLRLKRHSVIVAPAAKEETDRCTCCTKDEFWVIYDVFACMDRRQEDSVSRRDFVWALSAHGASVEFQKVVRRSQIGAYFKSTARDISIEEFMRRSFPNANAIDVLKMQRWVSLRKAYNLLTSSGFTANQNEFEQVFSFLEDGCTGTISATELLRANILSRVDVKTMLPTNGALRMSFDEFRENLAVLLIEKYLSEDNKGKSTFDPNKPCDSECIIRMGLKDQLSSAREPEEDPAPPCTPLAEVELVPQESSPLPADPVAELISKLSVGKQSRNEVDLPSIWPCIAPSLLDNLPVASPARERFMSQVYIAPTRSMEHCTMVSVF